MGGIQESVRAKPRQNWMDLLRGTSILLVILSHTVLFAADGGPGVPLFLQVVDNVFAPVRMPLMVFLSGLLVSASLKKGATTYLEGKGRRVLYPYVVWGIIGVTVDGIAASWDGQGFSPLDYLRILYAPVTLTWFLAYLTIFFVIALLTKKVPDLAMSGAALFLCAVTPHEWHRFFFLLGCFMLGKWCSDNADKFEAILTGKVTLLVSSVISASLVLVGHYGFGYRITYEVVSLPVVLCAFVVVIRGARIVQYARPLKPLMIVGQNSIIYYLAHWHGVALGMKIARLIAPDEQFVFLICGVAGGLAVSVVAKRANDHVPGGQLLFALPKRKPRVQVGRPERAKPFR